MTTMFYDQDDNCEDDTVQRSGNGKSHTRCLILEP